MGGVDVFNEQALGVLTSPKLLHALDLSREDQRLAKRYGQGENRNRDDGGPRMTEHFLAARRLVEAGARVVTLGFSRWDYHSNNFGQLREDLPLLDSALSALITDLHERGMDKDVAVVVWGEFGRTPMINPKGGRDHWPRVSCALLAGRNRFYSFHFIYRGLFLGNTVYETPRDIEYAMVNFFDRRLDFLTCNSFLYNCIWRGWLFWTSLYRGTILFDFNWICYLPLGRFFFEI